MEISKSACAKYIDALPIEHRTAAWRAAGAFYGLQCDAEKYRERALELAVMAVGPCPGEDAHVIASKIEAVASRLLAFRGDPTKLELRWMPASMNSSAS